MSGALAVSAISVVAVLLIMLAESQLSRHNERTLRAAGAVEPEDDVMGAMTAAYPGSFLAMAVEGAFFGPDPGTSTIVGGLVFAAAKALKFWAIASLGPRWTFRVLVPPDSTLVTSGPYAFLRHPNYVAVIGELLGMAILVGARVSGPLTILLFAWLIRRRIGVEERALRHPPCNSTGHPYG
jgi:methyltransferase